MQNQSLVASQKLAQHQGISNQMQFSLRLLQASTVELQSLIREELEVNPTLESEVSEISLDEASGPLDLNETKKLEELSQIESEWREYLVQSKRTAPPRSDAEEKYQYQMDSLVETASLSDHLLQQLCMQSVSVETRRVCQLLIGCIDSHGYLAQSDKELCDTAQTSAGILEEAVGVIQSLDPVGIGARNLQDCLMIQLERLEMIDSLEYEIVTNHFDALGARRYEYLSEELQVEPEGISLAIEFISSLDPKPGHTFTGSPTRYVTPDVYVRKSGDQWKVSSSREEIPNLKISRVYKDMLSNPDDPKTRKFLREKIKSGRFLINCLEQRYETILSIAREIVSRQSEFFEEGISALKPMNMAEVAEAVGVHETTVSRAVAGKYMSCQHGLIELRDFFTSGYQSEEGTLISNSSVKQKIQSLVDKEDKSAPLTDKQMVDRLSAEGIRVARRTIAKYRGELNILPSKLRRVQLQ